MGLLDFWTETIGVDAGSQSLRIIKDGKLIFNERSQISINTVDNLVSGLGNSIRTTPKDAIIKPVNYSIWDFHAFEMFLRGAIKKGLNSNTVIPKAYIMHFCIPTGISEVEKRAYRDSGEHANAKEVYMIHQCYCAAIGLNILFEVKNFILIDFSSSKIEITIFANSLLISVGSLRLGTWKIFVIVRNYIHRTYKIDLSEKEIEDLLTNFKNVENLDEIKVQYKTIKTKDIRDLLDNFFNLVNDQILETIELVSNHPDIEKIINNGVYFTGGGSTIEYLRKQIKLDSRIKCTVSQTPFLDNINGLKVVMADKIKFKNYIMT